MVEKIKGALRVSALDPRAAGLGLRRGLTLADARARLPDLHVAEADPPADARLLKALAEFCDRFTPQVALDCPDGLLLDIAGAAHLFGGEARLRTLVMRRMATAGLSVRASIAATPDAARALARFSRIEIAPDDGHEASLRPLPISALRGIAPETVLALHRAGLKTIGDLARRPAEVLAARFGQDLITSLNRVLGRENPRITPLKPRPPVVVERQFAEPFTHMPAIESIVGALIAEARVTLEERGEGGRVFEAHFFRSDGARRNLKIETGRPSRDCAFITKLFAERLDTLADPLDPGFGFDCIRLSVPLTETLDTEQSAFERAAAVDSAEIGNLVDRLAVRFGAERVLRFERADSYAPEHAARLVAAASTHRPATGALDAAKPDKRHARAQTLPVTPEPGEPPARPLHLFTIPQPIEALAEVPDGPPLKFRWRRVLHHVTSSEGPERIAPEWWRTHAAGDAPDHQDAGARDYYRVEDESGGRFWIFRHGFYGVSARAPRWFVHGIFA